MSDIKHSNAPLPIAEELRRDLVVRFLAELLQVTGTPKDQKTFQQSLQTYVDGLRPWLESSDGPPNPRAVFSLLEHCEFDKAGEQISIIFSPEAEALFRAWLRRNKVCNDAGLNTAHAWSN